MSSIDPDTEFRAAVARAGITIPPDRYAIMKDAYFGWRELAKLLEDPLPHAAEPAASWIPQAGAKR